ncbi:serine hydrolase domain-containing protein [Maribacter sp. 2307ULW6-5]|uniref:serine hydrolase domain-containing protein n=1 Tax=Maribacter sp. 2307ULW6-5 TaxID=3386275 RepID=UPI0039BD57E6
MTGLWQHMKGLLGRPTTGAGKDGPDARPSADALLRSLAIEGKVPGLAISVLKHGRLVFEKGYGHAHLGKKVRVRPRDTIFRTASVSKPIAATALAHAVHQGIISLDASLYDYVPYFPKKRWDFTIRQLANHTAGIRKYRGKEFALNLPYTIKESLVLFKDDALLFAPGTDYTYTSYDWVLISLAIQEAAGMPFEDYVEKTVLAPLGIRHTFAPVRGAEDRVPENLHSAFLAQCYTRGRHGFRKALPVQNFYKLAGGGYLSTTADIAKFGQAHLDGKVLDPQSLAPFLVPAHVKGESTHYGLGWQVSQDAHGRPYYGHVGSGVGGYSNLFIYPEQQMVFAILINCTDPGVQEVLHQAVHLLLAEPPV